MGPAALVQQVQVLQLLLVAVQVHLALLLLGVEAAQAVPLVVWLEVVVLEAERVVLLAVFQGAAERLGRVLLGDQQQLLAGAQRAVVVQAQLAVTVLLVLAARVA